MATTLYTEKIAEIVSQNSLLATALKRFDLPASADTLDDETWSKVGVDSKFLLDIIWAFDNPRTFESNKFMEYPIPIILDYLQKTHQYYIDQRLSEIELSIFNIQKKCNDESESLYWQMVQLLFNAWRRHLLLHVEQEETTLFPYVAKLQQASESKKPVDDAFTIAHFMHQHEDDSVESGLKEMVLAIKNRLGDISEMPLSVKILITQLDAFERDLWVHGMIEDEVLVPKAQQLESEVRTKPPQN